MALTATERVEVRRHAGYPAGGTEPDDDLKAALDGISAEGEAVLRTTWLARLATVETALMEVAENASTAEAAVWKRNEHELAEKAAMVRWLRVQMCRFLGVEPGASVNEIPAFTACCQRAAAAGGGGEVPVDPVTGMMLPPAMFVV